jgi:hypothetical protein
MLNVDRHGLVKGNNAILEVLEVFTPTITDREFGIVTYRDTVSRVFVKESLNLFRNSIIDFRLCVLPPRMNHTITWAPRCLPEAWTRAEDIGQPLPPQDRSTERDDYFFNGVIDCNKAKVFLDLSMWVVVSSDTM